MTDEEKPLFLQKIEAEKLRLQNQRQQQENKSAANIASQQPAPHDFTKFQSIVPKPDFEPDPYGELFDNLSIIEAYRLWCGKMVPTVRPGQTESILISCPIPGHRDDDPSAWVNTDKNTWYCGRCQRGGDVYDLAAIHYQITDYKSGTNFGKLRRSMAGALGYSVAKVAGKDVPYMSDVSTPGSTTSPIEQPGSVAPAVSVSPDQPSVTTNLSAPKGTQPFNPVAAPPLPVRVPGLAVTTETDEELFKDSQAPKFDIPTLDWKYIIKAGSFLDHYMKATTVDDIAEEFHFWNGLLGIGLAAGRNAFLQDQPRVHGNLFVVLLGETGDGKSRSFRYIDQILKEVIPFDKGSGHGYKPIPTPGSGEHMIASFMHPIYDVQNPKLIIGHSAIKSIVRFNEFEELVAKIKRQGSTLRNTVIDFYDCAGPVMSGSLASGDKKAEDHFCSIFSTTQLASLTRLFEDNDASSGFMNRWVFASGKPKTQSFFSQQTVDLEPAIESYRDLVKWIGLFKKVTVSVEAIDILEKFFKEVLHDRIKDPTGLYSRFSLLLKKLLLLVALNEKTDLITAEIAQKVLSLYPYLVQAYKVPEESIGKSNNQELLVEISRHVKRRTEMGRGTTKADLSRLVRRKGWDDNRILMSVKTLIDMEKIEEFQSQNKGRPTTAYKWVGT